MSIFEGQIAVVTGAGSGIGKCIAWNLALEGAVVWLIDKNLASLELFKKEAEGAGDRLVPFYADLEKDQDIRNIGSSLSKVGNGIDILVHSAGVISIGEVDAASVEDFDRQYRINVRAPYYLTQVLLPLIRVRKGQLVFINSSSGLHSKAGTAAYAASKHALKAVADALREEVNREGLRVLSIYPGRTATPMQAKVFRMEGLPYVPENLLQPEDVARIVVDALRIDRTAEITDLNVRPAKKWD
jgi:NADP-dependent 3-hydroxy acid dehydrogenase YdfG